MHLLKQSTIFRFFLWIEGVAAQSILLKSIERVRRFYAESVLRIWIGRLFGGPDVSTAQSAWTAFWIRWNSACSRLGRLAAPIAERSLPVRFWKSAAVQNSLFFHVVLSRGMQRLIVVLFALYLPIDYLLRTYSPVAALASAWDEGLLIFGFLYLLFKRMFAGKSLPPRTTPFDLPLLLFMGLSVLLMAAVSPRIAVAFAGLRAVIQYMFWFYLMTRLIENDGDLEAFGWTLVGLGVGVSIHGILQYILGVPIPSSWVSQAEVGVRTRVFSIIGSPNIMGSFCVMIAPLTASYAYRVKTLAAKILLWTCTMLICLACLLTFSRGAWLGMAVAVLVFSILRDRRLIGLLIIAVGVAVFIPEVTNRITFLFTPEFNYANMYGGRGGRRREGLLLLQQANAWIGYGLGRFGGAVAMQNKTNGSLHYFYMDNYYLKTLVEMGVLGLGGYLLTLFATLFVGLRSVYRTQKEPISAMAQGILAGLCGVLVHCLTENIFEVPYMNAYFWGMFGIVVYIGFLRKGSGTIQKRS